MSIKGMSYYEELDAEGKLGVIHEMLAELSNELYDSENVSCLDSLIETLAGSLKFNEYSRKLLAGAVV